MTGRRLTVGACALALWMAATTAAGVAQGPTEDDLAAASAGRALRVRTDGRVTRVPMELYVARVIAGEGESRAPEAAQRALAIAIRTFAFANGGRHRRDGFDLCDSTHCQVLRASTAPARRAALATAGQVLMYDGRPADVFYSASCGGRSEAVAEVWPGATDHPYLPSVEDDVHAGELPWVVDIPAARVEQVLRRAGFEGRSLKDLRVERRSLSGRVASLQVRGMRPDTIAGDDFRAAVGPRELRSTAFTVTKAGRAYRFTGKGYGHGVGMCVVGAGLRAARGETTAQILAQYYPGLTLAPDSSSRAPAAESGSAFPSGSTPPWGLDSWGPTASWRPASAAPPGNIVTRAPADLDRSLVSRVALAARDELAAALGVIPPPGVTIEIFDSIEAFRQATGRPWWTTTVVDATAILLPPPSVLAQRDGLEAALRRGLTEMLTADALADRPAWVRVGAARYFAKRGRPDAAARVTCPADAELTLAIAATAQREAERRAEACFARALARKRDWRAIP